VEDIVPSVGRTGIVTPVALMRPVEIGGVTVARASLHNREEVEAKDIRVGDEVRVQRAGDVIPEVVERIPERGRERSEPFSMPASCPSCGTKLVTDGPHTVCPNDYACPAQLAGRLVHFTSRPALDIEGVGAETAQRLVSEERVKSLPVLFDLEVEHIESLEGFARKSAEDLVAEIRSGARTSLARFLYGLGVPDVGEKLARDLAENFGSIEALRSASEEDLCAVNGVGEKTAANIAGFFSRKRNARVIDGRIEISGSTGAEGDELEGLTFVFTGSLDRLARDEAEDLVAAHGGRATSSVSGNTDYLVAGEKPGSKYDAAREADVTILDEDGFFELLGGRGVSPSAT
jgi:DNA ligase (NAD+)